MTPSSTRIDICVCTWRRPFLERTLASIAALDIPEGVIVRVIVADNDDQPSAHELVTRVAPSMPMDVDYIHCPASNISLARNTCLNAAHGEFVALIDDDSLASRQWLQELLKTASETRADVVLGPVAAIYAPSTPRWVRDADLHSTKPVFVNGAISQGYTSNALIRRNAPSASGRRFNLALGRTGGEDTEFFAKLLADGGRFAYAPKALVEEPVTTSRASFRWLARRRFRSGQTHGRLLVELQPGQRVRKVSMAVAKMVWCAASGVLAAVNAPYRNTQFIRAALHLGAACALLGLREIRLYGDMKGGCRHAA